MPRFMDLAAYRDSAESFVAELTAEYYRHYAGLKDEYELGPIYERHAALFTREAVGSVRSLTEAANGRDRRRLTMLLDFAVEGYMGQLTSELEAELAGREATLAIALDGERIGFRESAVVQANEADGGRRQAIEAARLEVTERELNPLHRELLERRHATARELGFSNYRSMCEQLKGYDLDRLAGQTAAFAARTAPAYRQVLEPALQATLAIGLDQLRRADLPRFFRAPRWDQLFPGRRLVESLTRTARGLGIDLAAQSNVVLDVEPRPHKSPRAFCAPVRPPEEVYLVISPTGGRDDYEALFHEAGHTEHFAHMDPALPFEYRYLGDNAVTEAFAFLFQHLLENPEWLATRLGVGADADGLAGYARAKRLIYLRRYAAKLAYELELHTGGASAARYAELLGGALGIEWSPETWLTDVDAGFYCACYLRAWALETHLRALLSERFGQAWFEQPAAGELLRELWREGQRLTAEELLAELTGGRLDFAVMAVDLGL
jgi:hypothetical protein